MTLMSGKDNHSVSHAAVLCDNETCCAKKPRVVFPPRWVPLAVESEITLGALVSPSRLSGRDPSRSCRVSFLQSQYKSEMWFCSFYNYPSTGDYQKWRYGANANGHVTMYPWKYCVLMRACKHTNSTLVGIINRQCFHCGYQDLLSDIPAKNVLHTS